MCGGSSSSDKKTTEITTTTTTNMRDVGLTGQHAVDMAAVMQTGAIESTRISATSLDHLIQQTGKTAQQLIGGASNLVRTQGEITRAQLGQKDKLIQLAPYAIVAVIGIAALSMKQRGH